MRSLWIVLAALSACVAAPKGHLRRLSVGQVEPAQRDVAFARALQVMQANDWIVAVADRPAGLITSQTMNTGQREYRGSRSAWYCDTRSALQITISDAGDVSVNLHREFRCGADVRWFLPTDASELQAIEQEQDRILAAIVGAGPIVASQR
jgi:hypothetical protein